MKITLENTGKRFNRDWVFRHVNFQFQSGTSYSITGPNGSGKSTLLQLIAGSINISEGNINYLISEIRNVTSDIIYKHISIAAPYLEVIEEMTAKEFFTFHHSFKPIISSLNINQVIEIIGLGKAADKQIRFYSSGMKQRIKLAQAIFSDVPVLLLDEPCTNFDEAGYKLYYDLIKTYCTEKLIIVSSNDKAEYNFCTQNLQVINFK